LPELSELKGMKIEMGRWGDREMGRWGDERAEDKM
jgi:hypothetical protein